MGNSLERIKLVDEIVALKQNFPGVVKKEENLHIMTNKALRIYKKKIEYWRDQQYANSACCKLSEILDTLPLYPDQKKALMNMVQMASIDGQVASAISALVNHYQALIASQNNSAE